MLAADDAAAHLEVDVMDEHARAVQVRDVIGDRPARHDEGGLQIGIAVFVRRADEHAAALRARDLHGIARMIGDVGAAFDDGALVDAVAGSGLFTLVFGHILAVPARVRRGDAIAIDRAARDDEVAVQRKHAAALDVEALFAVAVTLFPVHFRAVGVRVETDGAAAARDAAARQRERTFFDVDHAAAAVVAVDGAVTHAVGDRHGCALHLEYGIAVIHVPREGDGLAVQAQADRRTLLHRDGLCRRDVGCKIIVA